MSKVPFTGGFQSISGPKASKRTVSAAPGKLPVETTKVKVKTFDRVDWKPDPDSIDVCGPQTSEPVKYEKVVTRIEKVEYEVIKNLAQEVNAIQAIVGPLPEFMPVSSPQDDPSLYPDSLKKLKAEFDQLQALLETQKKRLEGLDEDGAPQSNPTQKKKSHHPHAGLNWTA